MADIRHVFVLVMENRSFDHVLGLSRIGGMELPPPLYGFGEGAEDRMSFDPEHEFDNVQGQISGEPSMSGFGKTPASSAALRGYRPEQVPVVHALASEYLLFDNWFSSIPGPTWPNRFFVHAASSGGLANSPGNVDSILAVEIDALGFRFENGTLFERIEASQANGEQEKRKWRVYHADGFPQVLAIKGLVKRFLKHDQFRRINPGANDDPFAADLANGYDVAYTFIEPDYGLMSHSFSAGNSQHPVGSMSAGERFIKYVYETIRNSPVWPSSALLLTWDEHGGFFDREDPPKATPPGDEPFNAGRSAVPTSFAFDRFGVRVPALLISPWVRKGVLSSQVFGPDPATGKRLNFDHASIISSMRELFGLGAPLTQRDANAPSWVGAFQSAMRADPADCPATLPDPYVAPEAARTLAQSALAPGSAEDAPPADSQVDGFMLIAREVQLQMDRDAPASAPIAAGAVVPPRDLALQRDAETMPVRALFPPADAAAKLAYISAVARRAGGEAPR